MTPYRTNVRPPGALRRATTLRERAAVAWRRWWRRRLAPVVRFIAIWGWARELEKTELEAAEAQRRLVRMREEAEALLRETDTLVNKTLSRSIAEAKLPPLPPLPPLTAKIVRLSRKKQRRR